MRQFAGHVGIRVEIIAGEIGTIATESQTLAFGALIGLTPMLFAEGMPVQRYSAIMIPTPFAEQDLNRHVVFLRYLLNFFHRIFVLMGQKVVAIEAVQTAGGSHLKIIHG
jgi:hypothetical protein